MGKNEIIEELFKSKEFNDCIGKMEPVHLRDDLRSEVVLILLETDEEKIRQLHERSELKYYTVRIILNLIRSKTSKFYKQYRQPFAQIDIRHDNSGNDYADDIRRIGKFLDKITIAINQQLATEEDHKEREAREEIEDKALGEVENLYWYNKELVQLYLQHGNYRAIEKLTKIPFVSAYKTIQRSLQEIKQKALR